MTSNDIVVLYTDGITEAMNIDWEEFGEKGLQAFLKRQEKPGNAQAIILDLDREINRFCGDVAQNDDIAAVVIKVD